MAREAWRPEEWALMQPRIRVFQGRNKISQVLPEVSYVNLLYVVVNFSPTELNHQ